MAKANDLAGAVDSWLEVQSEAGQPVTYAEGTLYMYRNGYWMTGIDKAETPLRRLADVLRASDISYAKEPAAVWREVSLRLMSPTGKPIKMDERPALVCTNGTLMLEDRTLVPHSPETYFRRHVNLEYNPKARCPEWLAALDRMMSDWPKHEAEEVKKLLQEYFGVAIVGKRMLPRSLKQALFLYGPPRTGKTSIADVLRAMYPEDLVSSLTATEVSQQFGKYELTKALAWIADEAVNSKSKIDSGDLKRLFDGDLISTPLKYRDPIPFRFDGPVLWTANNPIATDEDSDALYVRILAIEFTRVFSEDDAIEQLNNHKRLVDYITAIGELPGVLNWALDGYDRAAKQMKYTDASRVRDLRKAWLEHSSPVADFLYKATEYDGKTVNFSSVLSAIVSSFALRHHGAKVSRTKAARGLEQMMRTVHPQVNVKKTGGKNGQTYSGVKLNDYGLELLQQAKEDGMFDVNEKPKVNEKKL